MHIVRVHSTSYDRTQLSRRAANYVTYLARTPCARVSATERPDVVLCMTDPPFIGAAAELVARRFGAPLRRDQPGRLPGDRRRGPPARESAADRAALAARVASTSRAPTGSSRSARRCAAGSRRRASPPDRLRVIPNWVDTDAARAEAAGQRVGARERARRTSSSSCTPATSATRRISRRSSARRRSSATSTTSRS